MIQRDNLGIRLEIGQRLADRPDLAVHHARRRNQVRTGLGLGHGDLPVDLERAVVVDLAGLRQHAAVAVVRVLVQTEVGDEDRLVAQLAPQRAQPLLRDPVRRV